LGKPVPIGGGSVSVEWRRNTLFYPILEAGTLDFAQKSGDPYGIRSRIQIETGVGLAGSGGGSVAVRFFLAAGGNFARVGAMNVLRKIAMAPLWVLIGILVAPFLLLGWAGQLLERVSPDGKIPKRKEGQGIASYMGSVSIWAILTGIFLLWMLQMLFREQ
jgi:hypothetical protein